MKIKLSNNNLKLKKYLKKVDAILKKNFLELCNNNMKNITIYNNKKYLINHINKNIQMARMIINHKVKFFNILKLI